jgi:hypothetical protein
MSTKTTSSRRFSLRSSFAGLVPVALLLAFAGAACSNESGESESVGEKTESAFTVAAGNLTLSLGESVALQTTVSTSSAARMYTLQYQSSNTKIATVSSAGVVSAIGAGTAQITVTARLLDTGGTASAVATVTVGGAAIADAGAPDSSSGTGSPPSTGASATFDTGSPGAGWDLFYPNAAQAPAFQKSLNPADHPLQNGSNLNSAVYVFTQGSGNVSVQSAPGGRQGKVMMMTLAPGSYSGNNRAQVMATIPNATPAFGDKNHVWLWKFSIFYPTDFNLEPSSYLHLDPHGDSVNAAHTDDVGSNGAFKFQIWGGAGQGPDWSNILTEYNFGKLSAFTGKWVDYELTIKPSCTNGNGIFELRVNGTLVTNTRGGTRWTGPNSFCVNRDGTGSGEVTNFQIGQYIWETNTARSHRMYVGPMTIWRRSP